ncbi:hypothetical protein [Pseudomonas panipatensis]|uniref:hypothetical protein n=1 Tax=Pseudomonas panipatensis TaxID=428992 RepID=UPI0035B073B5
MGSTDVQLKKVLLAAAFNDVSVAEELRKAAIAVAGQRVSIELMELARRLEDDAESLQHAANGLGVAHPEEAARLVSSLAQRGGEFG